jgi:tRNA1Val (adenine37-N6)-methyltransferase
VTDETVATLACGGREVRLLQRRGGYRVTQDARLLAEFACLSAVPAGSGRVLDLGCGGGAVALLVQAAQPEWAVEGLEVQPALAALARRNAALNGLPVTIHEGDWREPGLPAGAWSLVTCNPPYHPVPSGRLSPYAERALSRHELRGAIEDAARAARRLLSPDGAAAFVYPAGQLARLFAALGSAGLGPVRMRFVHPASGASASTVLVEARPGSRRPVRVEAP